MFRIAKNYYSKGIVYLVERGNDVIEFNVYPTIAKKNSDELKDKLQFEILNSYVDYKGNKFKDELFKALEKAHQDVESTGYNKGIVNGNNDQLPYEIVNGVLDIITLQDMLDFLKNVYKLKPLANLADHFDPQIEKDGKGTRAQTFIKEDYMQLAALAIVLKAAVLPVLHFAWIKQKEISPIHREYIIFHIFKKHSIYRSEPMNKLKDWVYELIYKNTGDMKENQTLEATRVLDKQLPSSEIPFYLLSMVVIQKLCTSAVCDDTPSDNIINRIYKFINGKLKQQGSVSTSIRHKTLLADKEGGSDRESLIESYRLISDIANSTIVELDWVTDNIDKLMLQLPDKQREVVLNSKMLEYARETSKAYYNLDIENIQITILSIIFKSVLDPRSIDYVKIDGIVNMLAIGFAYLWGLGLKDVAVLLLSKDVSGNHDEITLNSTVNRTRLTKEIKDELDYFFPYKRVISDDATSNIIVESIDQMISNIYSKKWYPVCDMKYFVEAVGTDNSHDLLNMDLKVSLAEFIIKNEKILSYSTYE